MRKLYLLTPLFFLSACTSQDWNSFALYTAAGANGFSRGAQQAATQPNPYYAPPPARPEVIETRIDGDFNGWEGETIWVMENGQVWRQRGYSVHYHYLHRPRVLLINSDSDGWIMKVDRIDSSVRVERLK